MKRIIIELKPSIQINASPEIAVQMVGVADAIEALQILHVVMGNILQQQAEARNAMMANRLMASTDDVIARH